MPILNKEQQEASDFYCGNCAVIAVPGSGKNAHHDAPYRKPHP